MKRSIGLILRIVIAAAGLTFIALSVTWTDSVVAPAGFVLTAPDGATVTLDKPRTLPVVAQTPESVTVQFKDAPPGTSGESEHWTIRRSQLASGGQETSGTHLPGAELPGAGAVFHPGVVTMLAAANWWMLLAGLVFTGIVMPMQAYRWLILMRCRGMTVGFFKAFKLSLVGLFFNFCMPGSTGGDVIKAYYAAKGSGEKPTAVMSVVFDRIVGLVSLLIIAVIAGGLLLVDVQAPAEMKEVVLWLWAAMAGLTLCSALYFSRGARRRLGIDKLLARWDESSMIRRVDAAAHAYRHHPAALFAALGMAALSQVFLVAAGIAAGWALGMQHAVATLALALPVLLIAGSVPLTYQGLGVMEGLGLLLLEQAGLATDNQVVGMLLLLRLFQVFYGLAGSVFMLSGDIHLHPQEPAPPSTAATSAAAAAAG